jgi:hypothetical protein
MQEGENGRNIGLTVGLGIVLLTALLLGTLYLPHANAFRHGLSDKHPFTVTGGPHASTPPRGKANLPGAPAGPAGGHALVVNRPGTSGHLAMRHPTARIGGQSQRPPAERMSPKTHRRNLYTVLLLLFANSRY